MYDFSFICRKSKANKQGLAPIELSIIINKERTYIALPMKTDPLKFTKMMNSKKNNEVQQYTSTVRTKLNKCINDMMVGDVAITAKSLKEFFQNGGTKSYTLFKVADEFLEYYTKKSVDCTSEVIRKYRLAIDKFKKFIGDVELRTITPQHIEEFKVELLQEYKLEQTTANYVIARCKTMITYAFNKGYISVNPMAFITISKKQKDVEFLTNDEVERIASKDFNNERLNKVRDLFLFQCETALAFADMVQISFLDIKNEEGMYYVKKKRQKTGIEFFTVLSPLAMDILKRYNFNLDIISNQKANAYLKEIADLCRIDKPLHTHIARHTAATRLLNNGHRLEVVAKILGHTNTKQTQHYAKLIDKTVLNEFKRKVG